MKKIIFIIALFFTTKGQTQSVGIGTASPHPSALLDLQSNEKGFLLPRLNSTERVLMQSPATGLLVFDTDKGSIYMFDGVEWVPLGISNESYVTQPRGSNTPAANTALGWRACISGNYAVVSSNKAAAVGWAPFIDTAFVFEKISGSWKLMTKLVPSNAVGGEGFGRAVAIAGDYMLIGAPFKNNSTGAVYVFTRSGQSWNQTAILTASIPQVNSQFGATIEVGGSYALIGAPQYVSNGIQRGAVFSFSRNVAVWSEIQILWGISNLESFGYSIDVSGTYALIGAPLADHNGVDDSGIAYFYKRIGSLWTPSDTIYNTNAQQNDMFGFAVAVSESTNWGFISRLNRESLNANKGDVTTYVIWQGGLVKQATLSNPGYNNTTYFEFGHSLAVYNDYLLVGVPHAHNAVGSRGRVYIYKADHNLPTGERWHPWKIIIDETGIPGNYYFNALGFCVAINGFDVVIGHPGANNWKGKAIFMNLF